MGNPEVSSPLQFLHSLGTSPCDGVGEREPDDEGSIQGQFVYIHFFLYSHLDVFCFVFYQISQIDQTDTMDSGTGIVFVQCPIFILKKLFIKTFVLSENSALRSLKRHLLLSRKIREDHQENIKEAGTRGLICSLYSYSILTYIIICDAIMLNFQTKYFFRKSKTLKGKYIIH